MRLTVDNIFEIRYNNVLENGNTFSINVKNKKGFQEGKQ